MSAGISLPEGFELDELMQAFAPPEGFELDEVSSEPELTAGRVAGLAGRAGVQAAPGAVAGLSALGWDGTYGFLRNMGLQLANLKRRAMGEEELPYRDPFETTNAIQQLGELGADALGLPKPETDVERIAVAGGQTALEALSGAGLAKQVGKAVPAAVEAIPGSVIPRTAADVGQMTSRVLDELAEAPKTQALIGGFAGGGAQTAAEYDANPLIGMGAGLALGVGGVAAGHGIRQGVRTGRELADRALLRSDEARQQAAYDRVRNAASDPDAALREIEEGAGADLVPGSRATTFQTTGDMGLGSLERDLQTQNPEVFAQRRGEQNAARLGSLRSVQGRGDAEEIVSFLRGQLDDIDQITAGYETRARSAAEDAAEAIRPSEDDAGALGRSIRGSMRDAEDMARQRETALWDAVDPDGSLTVTTGVAKDKAMQVYGKLTQSARLGLSAEEKSFAELVAGFRPVESFSEFKDLSSQIKAAMREEVMRRGRTPAYARMAQLQQAVRSSMENSAAERIAADPIAQGAVSRWADEWNAGREIGGAQSEAGQIRSVRAGGVPGLGGAESARGGQSGGYARNQGVQSQARGGKPLSLTQFIAKNGGLPLDAEAAARDWGNVSVGRLGKLARPEGRSIDGYWRNRLIEEGYLPPDADGYSSRDITRELFDAIENERVGRKTFTAADQMRLPDGFDLDGPEAEMASAARQIREELQRVGVRSEEMSSRAVNDAAEMLARGDERDAVTAYERAVMNLDDEGPVHASYAPREGRSLGSIFEAFKDDPGAGKRYKAATEATRERIGTFNKGYTGQILRRDGEKDVFRMADGSVATNAFRPGPTGGERIKALVRAGAALAEIAEIAALSLRKAALKADGTIDPAKFQRWRSSHADALRELPEDVRARFANASLASQALNRVSALRKQKLDAFNKSVLGKVAKVEVADLPNTLGRILNGSDANKQMAQLVAAANKNPAAKEGLRRAVAEYILERFISNKEVAASGENGIRADAFQSFVRQKKGALTMVFGQEHVLRLQAIADDIKRAERSLYATKIPGNSNTPQDIGAALDKYAKKEGGGSLLMQVLIGAGGGGTFFGIPGVVTGTAAALGKHFLGSMRAAGLQKVDDLVLEIMLDPKLARTALMKAPAKPDTGAQKLMTQLLAGRAALPTAAAAGDGYEQ